MFYHKKRVESIKQNEQKYINLIVSKYIHDTNHWYLQDYQERVYARMDELSQRKAEPPYIRDEALFEVYLAYSDLLFQARMALWEAQCPKEAKRMRRMEEKERRAEEASLKRAAKVKQKVEAWKAKKALAPSKEAVLVSVGLPTPDETDALARLVYAYRWELDHIKEDEQEEIKCQEFVTARISATDTLFFVARTEVGELVGFAFLSTLLDAFSFHHCWHLKDLFVAKEYRGNSISTALIQGIATHFEANSLGRFNTEAPVKNKIANHLFITHGFSEYSPIKKYRYHGSNSYTKEYLGY